MAEQLAQQFTQFYYNSFDNDRASVINIYHPQAAMTFEGQKFEGQAAIQAKLTGLPFKTVKHVVTTCDVQPIPGQEAYIILVLGQLKTDDDPPHGFSEVFTIFNVNGQHVVVNDVFRLALHNG